MLIFLEQHPPTSSHIESVGGLAPANTMGARRRNRAVSALPLVDGTAQQTGHQLRAAGLSAKGRVRCCDCEGAFYAAGCKNVADGLPSTSSAAPNHDITRRSEPAVAPFITRYKAQSP